VRMGGISSRGGRVRLERVINEGSQERDIARVRVKEGWRAGEKDETSHIDALAELQPDCWTCPFKEERIFFIHEPKKDSRTTSFELSWEGHSPVCPQHSRDTALMCYWNNYFGYKHSPTLYLIWNT
jgi:hypothetical protein